MKKATNEQLIKSYQKTNSVWKTAKEFGMCGQSVWERLKKLEKLNRKRFSKEETEYLKRHYLEYSNNACLDELAKKMNRTKEFLCRKARDLNLTNPCRNKTEHEKLQMSKRMEKWLKENKHPRGHAGHKHTERVCKIISRNVRKLWADPNSVFNSSLFKQKQSTRASKSMVKRLKEQPHNIYSNCKRGWWTNGEKKYFMRSSWEMNYACYLEFLVKYKQIKKWEYETKTFWFNKIKRGVRSYTPDFKVYNLDNTITYHEVKGFMDAKSKTKLNRMKIYYPKIKIVLIDSKRYNEIKKQSGLFKGWR